MCLCMGATVLCGVTVQQRRHCIDWILTSTLRGPEIRSEAVVRSIGEVGLCCTGPGEVGEAGSGSGTPPPPGIFCGVPGGRPSSVSATYEPAANIRGGKTLNTM